MACRDGTGVVRTDHTRVCRVHGKAQPPAAALPDPQNRVSLHYNYGRWYGMLWLRHAYACPFVTLYMRTVALASYMMHVTL